MATLRKRHKVFIINALACYRTPSEVVDLVVEKFGIDVDRTQVAYYDPTSRTGGEPAEKWKELFAESRERWLTREQDQAIAQKRWRLQELEDIARSYKSPKIRMEALEQAAKETGGKYTNKQLLEHMGKDGGPMEFTGVVFTAPGEDSEEDE